MKRRILAFAIAVVFVAQLFATCVPVFAAATSTATLNTSSTIAEPGDVVTLTVSITSNPGLTYIKLKISYDTNALTLFGVKNGTVISDLTRGTAYVWSTANTTTATGTLATLIFSVSESAEVGNYPITITCVEASNHENDVSCSIQKGTITITPQECAHQMEMVSYKEPTCERTGSQVLRCQKCDYSETITFDVIDCVAEYEADCENDAECKYCGEVLEKAYGHNYRSKVIEPTVDSEGYTLYTCMRCGYSYEDDFLPPLQNHTHTYILDEIVSPTCTQKGYSLYLCSDTSCGATEKRNETAALGHKYGATIVSPTCQSHGYTLYSCKNCDSSYKDDIVNSLSHEYFNGICQNCGEKDPDYSGDIPDTQYDYDIGIENIDTMYFVESGGALMFVTFKNYGAKSLSQYRFEVYRNAPDGEFVYQHTIGSLNPGESFQDSFVANSNPTKNEIYYILLVPVATFIEDQNMQNNFAVEITKTKSEDCFHDATKWTAVNEEQHIWSCLECGISVTYEHFYMPSAGNACLLCGATQSSPHEHRFVEYFTYRPTCTQQGYTEYRCEDCFEKKNDNYVPALGHDYVNGVCDRCDAIDPNPGQTPVTGIKLNKNSASLKVGGSTILEATIIPSNATNQDIIWTVSDPSVVRMNNSVNKIYADVIALAPGTATITAKSEDGDFIAQCVVTVEGDQPSGDSFDLVLSSEEAMAGETVDVVVNLSNNPGITSLVFKVYYDQSLLTLTKVTYNTGMGGQTVSPKILTSPVTLYWVNGLEDYSGDGLFATLTFTVSENAKEGDVAAITVSHNLDDIFNVKEENVGMNVTAGQITVINYVPGDINGDGIRNNKDVTRFMQYNAGWDVEVNTYALDVNGDGTVSNKDVTRLMQYNAGWDVEIH